ncbi:Trypsin-like peptidase domain-containing protein [Gracilibacillus ureilyticus]|uniref:Trypsin-like peptidase domain-containing protein n=1 Tax=Gracilibacillus ureilyticus TaxID=531814 RepID=A0A1H9SG83_9BACI|nr:serine protease [Gracilibacillus ureilyticus]SER83393.1 Trypsin-like peptidase domain-containing protein [Gracilibacillus ureilyticus]
MKKEQGEKDLDIIDEDLYEDIDPEEMYELVQQERQILKEKQLKEKKAKNRFPKWIGWTIAIAMMIQILAILPQTFSIPAIEFLQTSAKLMQDEDVAEFRKAVVVIEGNNSKGTGFTISADGYILTNHHVIEDEYKLTVAFQEEGLYSAEVIKEFPEIDLALLKVEGEDLPYLSLMNENTSSEEEDVLFIGNPLRFNGIANQGDLIGETQLESWNVPVYMLDAPVYRGNSGSPVINQEGEVIAVIFATQRNEQHGKVGLAVPIDYFEKEYLEEDMK